MKLTVTRKQSAVTAATQKKRIAGYNEFDNGKVLHNWRNMSEDEAEELAKQASVEDPSDIYYVAYDDIMDSCSDWRWFNGQRYHWSDICLYEGKPHIKAINSCDTDDVGLVVL